MQRKKSRAPRPIIRTAVPNRVDLAGGTLDIYPMYLLIPESLTVNAAISVRSHVEVVQGRGPARLFSEDFRCRAEAADTHGFPTSGRFGLMASALRFFPPLKGIEMRFRNEAPLGSGIGASSSLLVATMLSMDALSGRRRGWEETARSAMEVEAFHLRGLTGRQDHIAALRGGIQAIRFLPGRLEAERIGVKGGIARKLTEHGFLAGTGQAHHSADVNWRMIRGAIDGNAEILRKFRGIAAAAREAWDALRDHEVEGVGRAVAREWAIRKTLAPGVSPARVERTLAAREFRGRVIGAKLCGAGGGGMMFGILRSPDDRGKVEAFLSTEGFTLFPLRLSGGPRLWRDPRVTMGGTPIQRGARVDE